MARPFTGYHRPSFRRQPFLSGSESASDSDSESGDSSPLLVIPRSKTSRRYNGGGIAIKSKTPSAPCRLKTQVRLSLNRSSIECSSERQRVSSSTATQSPITGTPDAPSEALPSPVCSISSKLEATSGPPPSHEASRSNQRGMKNFGGGSERGGTAADGSLSGTRRRRGPRASVIERGIKFQKNMNGVMALWQSVVDCSENLRSEKEGEGSCEEAPAIALRRQKLYSIMGLDEGRSENEELHQSQQRENSSLKPTGDPAAPHPVRTTRHRVSPDGAGLVLTGDRPHQSGATSCSTSRSAVLTLRSERGGMTSKGCGSAAQRHFARRRLSVLLHRFDQEIQKLQQT